MDPWFIEHLVCPRDHLPVEEGKNTLFCPNGHEYSVLEGVPVMLRDDVVQTIGLAEASLRRARDPKAGDPRAPELYLESLGISEQEKQGIIELASRGGEGVDPVASFLVGATSGCMYKDLTGRLDRYPIPELRLPAGQGKLFLELGCSWGRWCIAAARKGYEVVGVDPSLGAVMAARRVARELGVGARFLVADARYLPFKYESLDLIFSYSVLQHFSKADVRTVVHEVARTLGPGGKSMIQMASAFGVRSVYHQARRFFREAQGFEVRYWRPDELKELFAEVIGETSVNVDCYFGLGLQRADAELMRGSKRVLIICSDFLRGKSSSVTLLRGLADSVYVESCCKR